jgi:hypothetical protein
MPTNDDETEDAIAELPDDYREAFRSMAKGRNIDRAAEARMMARYLGDTPRYIRDRWAFVRYWFMRAEAGRG